MPIMPNPYAGSDCECKFADAALIQAVRQDICSEQEAIFLYDAHARATENEEARLVFLSIRDEERIHVGELLALLRHLDPKEATLLEQGFREATEIIKGK